MNKKNILKIKIRNTLIKRKQCFCNEVLDICLKQLGKEKTFEFMEYFDKQLIEYGLIFDNKNMKIKIDEKKI